VKASLVKQDASAAREETDTAASYDLFIIHTPKDGAGTQALARKLEDRGIQPWLAEEHGVRGSRWRSEALDVLSKLPACALVVGPAGLPGVWGRREVDEACARKARDPDFRFLLIYLPKAEPVPGEALVVAPDAVITFEKDVDDAGIGEIRDALGTRSGHDRPIRLSSSVASLRRIRSEVTSFALVRRLAEDDPDLTDVVSPDDLRAPPSSHKAGAGDWIEQVSALYDPDRVQWLDGRLMTDGLARLDGNLAKKLRELKVLDAIRSAITPPPATLLKRRRDAVDTLTDQPASVDELNRAVLAKVLATRMRRMRLNELARHRFDPDRAKRRGGPFLVHIYGRWGSGKTSLLTFLRDQLGGNVWGASEQRRTFADLRRERRSRSREEGDLGGDPRQHWIVIDFNAWQHQRIVPPWWWLMSAISAQGSRELRKIDRPRWVRLKLWDYGWRLRGAFPGILFVAAGLTIAWLVWKSGKVDTSGGGFVATALVATEGVVKSISAIVALLLTLWGGARALSRWLLVGSPRAAGKVLAHGRDPLDALALRFARLVRRLHYPVAIFIDDLDRCQASYVVELLEGIQTLFKDVPVTYVIAADREWVCQSFAKEYENFCPAAGDPGRPLGHLFLEKTFQISVPVPSLPPKVQQRYFRSLLRAVETEDDSADLDRARSEAHKRFQGLTTREDIDAELRDRTPETPLEQQAAAEAAVLRLAEPELEEETEHMLQAFVPLLEPNPRAMKRLINAYGIASAVEILRDAATIGTSSAESATPERLALWTILCQRWPLLGDYLTMHPELATELRKNGKSASQPPDDAPEWLRKLWSNRDVKAVLAGEAPHVNSELDKEAVEACLGT
jgi:hypothetical protein